MNTTLSNNRYGIVLKELKQTEDARQMLLRSVHICPLLWSSWQELAKLCDSRDMVSNHLQVEG